jgi:hypothetical protein
MRLAEKASRSIKFAIFWAADDITRLLCYLEGYLRYLALRVTWPCFGNTSVRSSRCNGRASSYEGKGVHRKYETENALEFKISIAHL